MQCRVAPDGCVWGHNYTTSHKNSNRGRSRNALFLPFCLQGTAVIRSQAEVIDFLTSGCMQGWVRAF